MLNRLNNMINGPTIPKLFVAQRVIDKMATAALHHLEDETGEAMFGMIIDDATNEQRSVYILDTISPGNDVVREAHTFQQGGDWQDEVLHWLRANWQVARKKRVGSYGSAAAAKWDSSLYVLGDWHKQPGFMIQPSGGDLHMAHNWIHEAENELGFLIAPILTINHPATVNDPEEKSNFIRMEQPNGLMTRVDFWYIDRSTEVFYPIVPNIVPDRNFPRLADYPWHLHNEKRAATEVKLLEEDGMLVEMLYWNADENLPLEVCFLTARPGADHFLLLTTQTDYPQSAPEVYTIPFTGLRPDEDFYKLMERQWTFAELVDVEDFDWTPEKTLLECVYVVEQHLGIHTEDLPATLTGKDEHQLAEAAQVKPSAAESPDENADAPVTEDVGGEDQDA